MQTTGYSNEVGDAFARETGDITVRRWRIGLTLYLAFAAVGSLVEWHHYPSRGVPLLVAYVLQVMVFAAGWLSMQKVRQHPGTAWIVLGCDTAFPLILAVYNATVDGDMLYVLITFLAVMLVSSVFIPWGLRFQLALDAGVIAAYVIGVVGGGRIGPIPAYNDIAIVATTVFSALGALYIDQYRRQLFAQAAALGEANQRLQAANTARTELLSGLSHDMRTPLGVLIGYGDILAESPELPADFSAHVRSIRREARQLLWLVEGVLDLARLEAGRLPFQRSTFNLAAVLDPLRETTEDQLRDGEVRLVWDIPAALTLDSDPGKVREIVRNLLSNAVKYTREGEIKLVAAPASGGVEISVTDTGGGIEPSQQEVIFDAFHREPGLDHRLDGLGFGLYMVRLLVQLTGGHIDVWSAPKRGSCFRVWLPAHPPPDSTGEKAASY